MKQEEYYKKLKNMIINNESMRVDLKNGVILDLTYEEESGLYRAYWKEMNLDMGTWNKKVLVQILNGEVPDVEILV